MEGRPPKKARATRAAIADRFKSLCLSAGLKVPEVAQALQVTERTVYAWFSGSTAVPYSAYKLLRVLNRFELPGRGWEGWHMHSGKLWTPEGIGIEPHEGAWWGLLVRQARGFRELYREAQGAAGSAGVGKRSAAHAQAAEPGPDASADGRRAAPPNLFL